MSSHGRDLMVTLTYKARPLQQIEAELNDDIIFIS